MLVIVFVSVWASPAGWAVGVPTYNCAMRALTASFVLCLAAVVNAGGQSAAGLRWTVPLGWRTEPAQTTRAATYTAAPVPGDTTRAECGVYFFGQGQGGSVDANVDRWKGQFAGADGAPARAQIAKRSARGLTITTVDVSGQYSGMGGPMANGAPVPGFRLLGAIVEGPQGNIFVKFTGPARTIGANQLQFEQLLASFHPAT